MAEERTRRERRFILDHFLVGEILRGRHITVAEMPADVQVLGIAHDLPANAVTVYLESAAFEPVAYAECIPLWCPEMTVSE